MRALALLAITVAGIGLCILFALPFLAALVWSASIAALAAPVQARLEALTGRPGLSAAALILAIGVVVVVPLALVGHRLVMEAIAAFGAIQQQVESGELERLLSSNRTIGSIYGWIEKQLDLRAAVGGVGSFVTETSAGLVQDRWHRS